MEAETFSAGGVTGGSEQTRTIGPEIERDDEASLIEFKCHVCGMSERCRFGNIKVTGRTHSYRYKEEVYYMLDPFRNRAKADERRQGTDKESKRTAQNSKAPNILDFFVVGALCSICGQSVCIDELCSVFYSKTFCSTCVVRERAHFPKEILQQIEFARNARERREAEKSEVKVPVVEADE